MCYEGIGPRARAPRRIGLMLDIRVKHRSGLEKNTLIVWVAPSTAFLDIGSSAARQSLAGYRLQRSKPPQHLLQGNLRLQTQRRFVEE